MDSGAINWTVVSVGIALVGAFITLAGLILVTTRSIRAEMRGLEARLDKRIDGLAEQQDKLAARQDDKMDALAARQDDKMDALAARSWTIRWMRFQSGWGGWSRSRRG